MKESKPKVKESRDPQNLSFDPNEFFQNTLALPEKLKEQLTSEGLDWRFLNKSQFRGNGNIHQSRWVPYKVTKTPEEMGLFGVTPEGYVERGDLILGARQKVITEAHKKFLKQRAQQQQGFNKEKVKELRKLALDHGVSGETKVYEGYDEND